MIDTTETYSVRSERELLKLVAAALSSRLRKGRRKSNEGEKFSIE